jgi:SAM-dependent methyltransferase
MMSASTFEAVDCYYCGGAAASEFLTAEDDLTGRPGRFTFVRCRDCSLVYQSPRPTLEHVKTYYESEYIAHRQPTDWGRLAPLFRRAIESLDRDKLRIVDRYLRLGPSSTVLDVGCGAGTFLSRVRSQHGSAVVGVDFMDLADRPALRDVEFHRGLFYEQQFERDRFDLITMWHFLEHDYDPLRSLAHARRCLAPAGRLIVEVPRLDSVTFSLFRDRWPGLQAPQHTTVYDRTMLLKTMERSGFEVLDHLSCGAFPPYFYLFCGVAFRLLRGRGLNLQKAIFAYFASQLLLLPFLPFAAFLEKRNLAMQTVVCRKAR